MTRRTAAAILWAFLASVALVACGPPGGGQAGPEQSPAVAGERKAQPEASPTVSGPLTDSNWDQVSADPDRYKGATVDLTGEVFNVLEDSDNNHHFQIYTDPQARKGNTHVAVTGSSRQLQAGYQVRVTGILTGVRVTRAVSGKDLKIPEVQADSVDVVGPPSVVTPTAIPSPTIEPTVTRTPTVALTAKPATPTPTAKPATPTPTAKSATLTATAKAATPTPTAKPSTATATAKPAAARQRSIPTPTPRSTATSTPGANRSSAPTGTPPPAASLRGTPVVAGGALPIFVEVGSAQLSGPMRVSQDSGAPSGRYLSTQSTNQQWGGTGTPPSTGEATVQIQVPRDGTYAIWSRMWYTGADGNSYWLIVDNQPGIKVGNDDRGYSQWKWVGWHDGSSGNRITVKLTAGVHTLHLVGREAGARIDSVLITDDPKYVPK